MPSNRPSDPARPAADTLLANAQALRQRGELAAALRRLDEACAAHPQDARLWQALGEALCADARPREAKPAFERALACDPGLTAARSALGDVLKNLGDAQGALACYRACLGDRRHAARSWFQIANIKTLPLSATDMEAVRRLHADPAASDADRVFLGYALSTALEDQGLYRSAFTTLVQANRLARRHAPWDAVDFRHRIDALIDTFSQPVTVADDPRLGHEVIFLIGMPRSGTTLTEQVLSMHPQVEGAGELPDLDAVLMAETNRRRQPFPAWVGQATPADWHRLGEDYLTRTARWRQHKPRFTDKGLDNWPLVGAALAMLPGARVVDCRRDPLETCLACFRQLFAFGNHFSYDLDELAAYWREYDRTSRLWRSVHAEHFHEHDHEAFQRDPEGVTRVLCGFLGLPFDPACLAFHESDRVVRTFSALQVRQPLRTDTARAPRYGTSLQPLRAALEKAGWRARGG